MVGISLLKELRKEFRLFGLVAGAGLAGGLAAVIQAGYLAEIVNGAFLDGLGLAEMAPQIYALVLAMAARAFFLWLGEASGFRLAANIKTALRRRLMAKLVALGPAYAGREQAGELINTFIDGVENLDAYFARYLPQLAAAALLPPVIVAVVFSFDIAAGLIMLVTAPLIPLFMILIGRWAGWLQHRQWAALSRLSGHFFDVLKGLVTLKVFGRSREQAAVIARLSGEFRDATLKVLKVAFLSALTLELLTTLSTALVAVAVGLKLLYGELGFRQAFFVLLLAPEYYLPLRILGSQFHAGLAGTAAAERIYSFLALPGPAEEESGKAPFAAGRGEIAIEFAQVSFNYSDTERPALQAVSFAIEPGERVALVGPSGAGKTTIADLLLGFIRPSNGTIIVNGRELGSIRRADWLRHVAYVPQFPHLFYGTISDNIRFGAPGGREKMEEASRNAAAHAFISRLPAGYDTVIGEGGMKLSGGEAQRIAIARAFFKDAPLVILDEATAGLDPETETLVREALSRLLAGRTAIIIAHRLSTACQADRILVLDGGKVAEAGTHRELLARQGLYFRLAGAYWGAV